MSKQKKQRTCVVHPFDQCRTLVFASYDNLQPQEYQHLTASFLSKFTPESALRREVSYVEPNAAVSTTSSTFAMPKSARTRRATLRRTKQELAPTNSSFWCHDWVQLSSKSGKSKCPWPRWFGVYKYTHILFSTRINKSNMLTFPVHVFHMHNKNGHPGG